LSEDEVVAAADPAEVSAAEGSAAAEAPTPVEEAGGAQLSLDEMVDSLRGPEEDVEAPSGEAATTTADDDDETASDTAEAATDEATASAAAADAEPATPEPTATASKFPHLALLRRLGARLPFWLYAGAWLLFAAGMAIALWPEATAPFTAHPLYAWFVLGGAGLLALGPAVALVAWLVLRARSDPDERAGLVRALFLRASLAMLAGSLLWWAALVVLDLKRAGLLG
jgi:hypothetical protein